MQNSLQLTFRSMAHSEALAAHAARRAAKLERLFARIISCHVVFERTGHHHRHGDRYRVALNLGLPGHELIIGHARPANLGDQSAHATVDRAFDEAERRLEEWVRRRRAARQEAAR
jgi:ribosomal subunit interface protein